MNKIWQYVIFLSLAIFGFCIKIIVDIYPELLWFKSVGYEAVYIKTLLCKVSLGIVIGISFIVISFINIKLALNFSSSSTEKSDDEDRYSSFKNILKNDFFDSTKRKDLAEKILSNKKIASRIFLVIISFFGLLIGIGGGAKWLIILKYLNQVPYGKIDPVFHKDISFYVFTLPFYRIVQGWLFTFILMLLIFTGIIYFNTTVFNLIKRKKISNLAKVHLNILGALFLLVIAFGIYNNMFGVLFSKSGAVYGAGFTDIHAFLIGYKLFIAAAVFSALLLIVNTLKGGIKLPITAFIVTFLTGFVMLGIYPQIVQTYFVTPNEFEKEKPYLSKNIEFSRMAYGLDKISERDFPLEKTLTKEDIQKNKGTIDNIRLWDHRPLKKTFSQLQEIRLYYEFNDVDIDRYNIKGHNRQVMLSARELESEQLTEKAQTWINKRLIYTHGYGLCMTPVSKFSEEGLPDFYIKDIPPQSSVGINIKRPEIYYGEKTSEYVIVNTKEKEFDYPKGDTNIYATYEGSGGIKLNNIFKRLLFAFKFNELKILISGAINSNSRLLWKRDIMARIEEIAPFLHYDHDPYIVIDDSGNLFWILDAYTITGYFPYSEPFRNKFNYIRNPLKVVVNAYSGDVVFYRNIESDFICETLGKIFPNLFKPFSQMPDSLKKHIRYPADMFFIQAKMYGSYHMKDVQVFYLREDLWDLPKENKEPNQVYVEPYYVNMKLPGREAESFLLMLPFTPDKKNNMIAWLSAECDLKNYGQLFTFKFPKKKLVYGPSQIEARIDQDPEISQKLSLWGQKGSDVIRGNLLVIPIEDSIIYVEPIYLQAEQGQIPELKRVVIAYGDKVVMDETMEGALSRIFGAGLSVSEGKIGEVPTALSQNKGERIKMLANIAQKIFVSLEERQRSGDWAGYGEEMKKLRKTLEELSELAK